MLPPGNNTGLAAPHITGRQIEAQAPKPTGHGSLSLRLSNTKQGGRKPHAASQHKGKTLLRVSLPVTQEEGANPEKVNCPGSHTTALPCQPCATPAIQANSCADVRASPFSSCLSSP